MVPRSHGLWSLKLENGGNVKGAQEVGKLIAKAALEAGITEVVFDRGGYIYHGRMLSMWAADREPFETVKKTREGAKTPSRFVMVYAFYSPKYATYISAISFMASSLKGESSPASSSTSRNV